MCILIPRHIEKGAIFYNKLKKTYPFLSITLSSKKNHNFKELFSNVVIIDKMNEIENYYSISDIILIGDSFIPSQGGHNFLEAIQFKKATIYGEFMISFKDITLLFEKNQGVIRASRLNLKEIIIQLINDESYRNKIGNNGVNLLKDISYKEEILEDLLK